MEDFSAISTFVRVVEAKSFAAAAAQLGMTPSGVSRAVARLETQLGTRLLEIQPQEFGIAGRTFNMDSPKQLQALLYEELQLPVSVKTPTGQPSTNEAAVCSGAFQ